MPETFFLLDGGATGNASSLLRAFHGSEKVSKSFTVLKDLVSLGLRHERVRGVGNTKQTETLLIVSHSAITLPPVKYQVYPGGTNGDVIGPAVLTPAETQWQATWGEKKKIFGPEQLIEVGGRLEADAPEPKRKKPRTDATMEPVFFHSMQVLFYQELLDAFNLIGVTELCPGEGTCAIACMKKMLPYVGHSVQRATRGTAHGPP